MNVLKTFIYTAVFFHTSTPFSLQCLQSSYKEMATGGAARQVCEDSYISSYSVPLAMCPKTSKKESRVLRK